MWWLHGPPFTENRTKTPWKSMTVGTAYGEGANRTYVNLALSSGSFLRAKRLNKTAGPVPRRNARIDHGIIDYPVNLGQELNIVCRP
jgi:hypothetical protein